MISGEMTPEAEAAKYTYTFKIVNRGKSSHVTKDLNEVLLFLRDVEEMFNGFTDA